MIIVGGFLNFRESQATGFSLLPGFMLSYSNCLLVLHTTLAYGHLHVMRLTSVEVAEGVEHYRVDLAVRMEKHSFAPHCKPPERLHGCVT